MAKKSHTKGKNKPKVRKQQRFYGTFGANHIHPIAGKPHRMNNGWVEIMATDANQARGIMFDQFGLKWSMIYDAYNFETHKSFFPEKCLMVLVESKL